MKIGNFEEIVANLCDKEENIIHTRNLKQALNHGLVLKKVHIIIKFNEKTWLKTCIVTNIEPRKNAKNDFEKDFFKVKNNVVFEENYRKCGKSVEISSL